MTADSGRRREQCWIIATTENADRASELAARASDLAAQHHAYIRGLDESGLLVLHGAARDEAEVRHGTGFIVIRATTRAEAENIARLEPYIANGFRTLNLIPWQVQWPTSTSSNVSG